MSSPFDALPASAQHAVRPQRHPDWVAPTLATLVHEPVSGDGWLFEPKLDGERCLVFKHGDRVRLLSRNQKSLNDTYPELVAAFAEQSCADFVADTEIVAFRRGRSSFARLQERMQVADAGRARTSAVAVYCYVFDLLHLDGHDVTGVSLAERKKLLARALTFRDPVRRTSYRYTDGHRYYQHACRAGWEGALAKDATSSYAHGRSRTWLKLKCVNTEELLIGGFTEPTGHRHVFGALLVGYYDGDDLVYAGKVGTGFTEDTLTRLGAELDRREQPHSPFVDPVRERGAHWVHPDLVAQVEFTEWTGDGKLRHPSYLGLRRDKNPTDVVGPRVR